MPKTSWPYGKTPNTENTVDNPGKSLATFLHAPGRIQNLKSGERQLVVSGNALDHKAIGQAPKYFLFQTIDIPIDTNNKNLDCRQIIVMITMIVLSLVITLFMTIYTLTTCHQHILS